MQHQAYKVPSLKHIPSRNAFPSWARDPWSWVLSLEISMGSFSVFKYVPVCINYVEWSFGQPPLVPVVIIVYRLELALSFPLLCRKAA